MKPFIHTLLLLFFTLPGITASAQTTDTVTYVRLDTDVVTEMDSISNGSNPDTAHYLSYRDTRDIKFQLLDKSRVTTGVLIDRVWPWKDPAFYNYSDSISYGTGLQIWHQFALASYNDSALLDGRRLDSVAHYQRVVDKVVPIGFVNYQYNQFDTLATDDGRLACNADSLFIDTAALSPYVTQRTMFPLICDSYIRNDLTVFYFNPNLLLQNVTDKTVTSIVIAHPSAGSITLLPGDHGALEFDHAYLEQNENVTLALELYFSDGSNLQFRQTFSSLHFAKTTILNDIAINQCTRVDSLNSGSDLKFQGPGEPYATEGHGEIKYYYRLDHCYTHLTQPIIVIDGYDPHDEGQPGPDGVYRLLYYSDSNAHLGLELRQMGYDLVVLNFPVYKVTYQIGPFSFSTVRDGGTDYIERNAQTLTRLIRNVNAELQTYGSSEKIVVIGPSMGGQIARYALKKMQNNNENHNCRLLTEFDSPNLGANIPLGSQAFLWFNGYLMNDVGALNSFEGSIRTAAGKELLIYQTGGDITQTYHIPGVTITGHSLNNTEPLRNQWQSMINALGYPSNLRKIAVTNGHVFGATEYSSPHVMLDLEGKKHSWPFAGTSMAHLKISSLPTYGHNWSVFDGYVYDSKDYHHNFGGTLPIGSLEFAPGGQFGLNSKIANGLKDLPGNKKGVIDFLWMHLFNVNIDYILTTDRDAHTFIPTVSALGFYNANFNWNNSINRNLVCSPEVPFDDYFTAPSNEDHVFISPLSAAWFKTQIQYKGIQGAKAPTPTLNSTNVGFGYYYVTFNVPEPPPGVAYSWSVNFNQVYSQSGTGEGHVSYFMQSGDFVLYSVSTSGICSSTKIDLKHMNSSGNFYRLANGSSSDVDFTVAPNPTNNYWSFNFTNSNKMPTSIQVFNIQGQKEIQVPLNSASSYELDASKLPPGTYICVISFQNGTTQKVKLDRL